MKLLFSLMIATTLASGQPRPSTDNPFFGTYTTPFGVPPFNKIRPEHYIPAFEEGIQQQKAQIQAMVRRRDAPTFENTIVFLDNSSEMLDRVKAAFYNTYSANTSEEIQKIAEQMGPILSKHEDEILMNTQVFQRVKAVYDQRNSLKLNTEQKTLLGQKYRNFVRSGANLSADKKARLQEINKEMILLTLKYGQNVLGENNAYTLVIDNEKDLSGLSESLKASAAEEATKRNLAGKWVFTLQNPSVMPFLQYADNRNLREQIFKAYTERANHDNERDNKENIRKIVALRAEKAQMLGYENHAAYVLEESMAKTPAKVNQLLNQLWTAAVPVTKKEAADLQALMDKDGKNEKLQGWDWRYYAEKLRKEKYDLDEEELRPYFSLENVKQGIFTLCQKLYGLTFELRPEIPVYHPEAMAYEVKEANGKTLGIMYMDFFPRASKRGGAWMTSYRDQFVKNGKFVTPVVAIVCNFTKPVGDAPALLNLDETSTFFHEFGHALHGLLSNVTYLSQSGTSVPRDFVELPSQILENWVTEPEMLKLYAKHYKTGEVIPEALVEKIKKSNLFNQGFETTEYLAASILDMNYHTLKSGQTPTDITAFEKESMQKIGLIDAIPPRYRSTYFQHIFSDPTGYSAGYYSYIWSAVLDADAFEVFKQKGLFDKKSAEAFRKQVLERGGTDEPMKLYMNFRGAEPDTKPLLRRRGLLADM